MNHSIRRLILLGCIALILTSCSSDDATSEEQPWRISDAPDMARDLETVDASPDGVVPADLGEEPDLAPPPEDMDMAPPPEEACPETRGVYEISEDIAGELGRQEGVEVEYGCGATRGPQHTYTLRVTQETGVRIWTTWRDDETLVPVYLVLSEADCDATELACSSPLSFKPEGFNGLIQTHLTPGRYRLTVSERGQLLEGGGYVVHTEATPLVEHAQCTGAKPLVLDQAYRETETDATTTGTTLDCLNTNTNVLYYTAEVPAEHTLHVTARYDDPDAQPPYVQIASVCEDSCTSSHGGHGLTRLSNLSGQPQTYIIAVENQPYRSAYEVTPRAIPMDPHATCANALPIAADMPALNQSLERGQSLLEECDGDQTTKLYYTATQRANHRLYVSGTRVEFRGGCNAMACVDQPYIHDSDFDRDLLIGAIGEGDESFDLRIEQVPLAPNASCDAPKTVTIGETLSGEDIRGGGTFFNKCDLVNRGYTLYYRVDVPLGMGDVRVRVEPDDPANYTASLQVLPGYQPDVCDRMVDTRCVASDRSYFRSANTDAEVTINASSGGGRGPATALVAVTMDPTTDVGTMGTFDLTVEYTP